MSLSDGCNIRNYDEVKPGISLLTLVRDVGDCRRLKPFLKHALPLVEQVVVAFVNVSPTLTAADIHHKRVKILELDDLSLGHRRGQMQTHSELSRAADCEWCFFAPVYCELSESIVSTVRQHLRSAGNLSFTLRFPGWPSEHATHYTSSIWRRQIGQSKKSHERMFFTEWEIEVPWPVFEIDCSRLAPTRKDNQSHALQRSGAEKVQIVTGMNLEQVLREAFNGGDGKLLTRLGFEENKGLAPKEIFDNYWSAGDPVVLANREVLSSVSMCAGKGLYLRAERVRSLDLESDMLKGFHEALQSLEPESKYIVADPLCASTLSLWKESVGDVSCKVCFEAPMQTARWLKSVFALPLVYGLRVWRRYYEIIIDSVQEMQLPCHFVSEADTEGPELVEQLKDAFQDLDIDGEIEGVVSMYRRLKKLASQGFSQRQQRISEVGFDNIGVLLIDRGSSQLETHLEDIRSTFGDAHVRVLALDADSKDSRIKDMCGEWGHEIQSVTFDTLAAAINEFFMETDRKAVYVTSTSFVPEKKSLEQMLHEISSGRSAFGLLKSKDLGVNLLGRFVGDKSGNPLRMLGVAETSLAFELLPCPFMVRTEVFRYMGGLDSQYSYGFEFWDWLFALKARGFRGFVGDTELCFSDVQMEQFCGDSHAQGRALIDFLQKWPTAMEQQVFAQKVFEMIIRKRQTGTDNAVDTEAIVKRWLENVEFIKTNDAAITALQTYVRILKDSAFVKGFYSGDARAIKFGGRECSDVYRNEFGEHFGSYDLSACVQRVLENKAQAKELNGRHSGETIFIVGAAESLLSVSRELKKEIEESISIGVNQTQYWFKPTYFLSSYYSHLALARTRLGDSTQHLLLRPVASSVIHKGILNVKRVEYTGEMPNRFGSEPTLVAKKNVIFPATHLALILGAKRIVYIGFEMRGQGHFYQARPKTLESMQKDLDAIKNSKWLGLDHRYERYTNAYFEYLTKSISDLEGQSNNFNDHSHVRTLQSFFSHLNAYGVEYCSAVENSVIVDAGAPFRPLAKIIEGDEQAA